MIHCSHVDTTDKEKETSRRPRRHRRIYRGSEDRLIAAFSCGIALLSRYYYLAITSRKLSVIYVANIRDMSIKRFIAAEIVAQDTRYTEQLIPPLSTAEYPAL